MSPIPFIDLKASWNQVRAECLKGIEEILDSQQCIGGKPLLDFEKSLGEFLSAKWVRGVSSGTDALLVSLMALEVKPGDEVITTPYTFMATAGSILRMGAKPVFADIDSHTWNIDPREIEKKISSRTVGILPVHLFGLPADMPKIMDIAREHKLWVIEDTAQAIGARIGDKFAGTFGDLGCISFYPTKNLGACGDAGAVVGNSESMANKIAQLRNHGDGSRYQYEQLGGNFRLDAIQACILNEKLKYLTQYNLKRRELASRYIESLKKIELLKVQASNLGNSSLKKPNLKNSASENNLESQPASHDEHVYHQFVIKTPKRDVLLKALTENEIGYGLFYPVPLHLQKPLQHIGYKKGHFPVAEELASTSLALPVYPQLTVADQNRVIEVVMKNGSQSP